MLWLLVAALNLESLWNWDDPAGSEQQFRAALVSATDTNTALEIQSQIARAQGLQGRFDEAHKTLDAITTNSPRVEVRYLLERGRVFNSSGSPDKAKPLFLAAWEMARTAGLDFLAVDAAHMVAIVESPDGALKWNETAIAFAEKSDDPKAQGWIGSLLNNLGWTYYDKGDYRKALEVFERDLQWFEERKKGKQAQIAREAIAECQQQLAREQATHEGK
jgi:tetratricopeptide (TPR) repeat protein